MTSEGSLFCYFQRRLPVRLVFIAHTKRRLIDVYQAVLFFFTMHNAMEFHYSAAFTIYMHNLCFWEKGLAVLAKEEPMLDSLIYIIVDEGSFSS